jgi:probable rRNA maturation factor
VSQTEGRTSKVERRRRILVLRNRQQTRTLNVSLLRRITRHLLEKEFEASDYEVGFRFVDSLEMARLNEQFLQHSGSTDVITFDYSAGQRGMHGEIFISIPDAVKQAREFRTTWQSEVARYVIHGLLHLRGFDDVQPAKRREMKREENRLLRAAEAQFLIRQLRHDRKS